MSKVILCADDSVTMQTVAEITFRATDFAYAGARSADGEPFQSSCITSHTAVDSPCSVKMPNHVEVASCFCPQRKT